jgi:hypothetical protein
MRALDASRGTRMPNASPSFPAVSIAQAHALLTSAVGSPFEVEEREVRGAARNFTGWQKCAGDDAGYRVDVCYGRYPSGPHRLTRAREGGR